VRAPRQSKLLRLAAVLACLASLLAGSAAVVRYVRADQLDWSLIGASLFLIVFGFNAAGRARAGAELNTRQH
jgi:hypothetical protein